MGEVFHRVMWVPFALFCRLKRMLIFLVSGIMYFSSAVVFVAVVQISPKIFVQICLDEAYQCVNLTVLAEVIEGLALHPD